MNTMLNIAKSNTEPFYIDPSEVTGVSADSDGVIALYNSQGELFRFSASDRLDVKDIVQKLAEHGRPLVYFPQRYDGEENKDLEDPRYISPDAVTFATISKPTDNDRAGAIIGVKGMGQITSYGATQVELDILVTSVRAAKIFQEYTPEQAQARWYEPAALYIDPKSVTKIRGGSFQVDVDFENSSSLDIQFKDIDLNDIDVPFPESEDKKDIQDFFAELQRRKKEADDNLRFDFANKLAAANGKLIALPFPRQATHIRKEDIGYISFYDNKKDGTYHLIVMPQKSATNPYPSLSSVQGIFNTAAERAKALKVLSSVSATMKKQPKPKI